MSTPALRAPAFRFIAVLCLGHAALTAWLGLARYAAVHNRTFDLALYARSAWGIVHGEWGEPILGGQALAGHVPLVLIPLGLLGRLFGTVPVLIIAQSLCVALAALPLSALATRRLGASAGAIVGMAWLLYPNLGHVTTYEFHPGTLAVLPLCCALDAFDRQHARALLWCCLAVVLCRASLALTTLMLSILAMNGAPALRRAGRQLFVASLIYGALSLWWLQPDAAAITDSSAALHYGKWGGGPLGVLTTLARDPALVFRHFIEPTRLLYPLRLLAPLALLPLLRPRALLLALPTVAQNLLSDFPTTTALDSHYLTPAVPALLFATADGLQALVQRWPHGRTPALAVLSLATLGGNVLAGGLPWSRDWQRAEITYAADSAAARAVIARVGPSASVQAPDALLPHFAERRKVHRAPPPERATDFVVLDVSHRRRFAQRGDVLRTIEEPLVRRWLARSDHRLLLAEGDLLLLARGKSPRTGLARRYLAGTAAPSSGKPIARCLAVRSAEIEGRRLWLEFVARDVCSEDLAIRIGTEPKPKRIDLLFDGLLSPAQVLRGDRLRSRHRLSAEERAAILKHGLRVGAVRSSEARPEPSDPTAVAVPVHVKR